MKMQKEMQGVKSYVKWYGRKKVDDKAENNRVRGSKDTCINYTFR